MNASKGRLLAAVALACLLGAAPAYADPTDDLLLTLKNKGILTEDEYQSLLARKAAAPAPAAAAPEAAAQPTQSSGFDVSKMCA